MDGLGVTELRLVVRAEDFEAALAFYRDVLGLHEQPGVSSPGGRVAILQIPKATLELADPPHAASIDELEVGRPGVAGHLRVCFRVADTQQAADRMVEAGAELVAPPTSTPWGSSNARLDGPAGLHLTVFGPA